MLAISDEMSHGALKGQGQRRVDLCGFEVIVTLKGINCVGCGR